jgi:hypothetical protein
MTRTNRIVPIPFKTWEKISLVEIKICYLSEMTSSARGFADEGGGTTDKSSVTSSSDDHEGFTTLDSRRGITGIAFVLVDSKGFTSYGRLIDLDEGVFGDDTAVGGDDGTFFDLDDIARNDFRGFDFNEGTISQSHGFEGKGFLQFFDNGASLIFLDETDGGVEEQ